MKFKWLDQQMSQQQRREFLESKQKKWHAWYAWYPIRVSRSECVWLETIKRRRDSIYSSWEYQVFLD